MNLEEAKSLASRLRATALGAVALGAVTAGVMDYKSLGFNKTTMAVQRAKQVANPWTDPVNFRKEYEKEKR